MFNSIMPFYFPVGQVSIMQIASDNKVYILDLIKLYGDSPDVLDDCLTRILHSPRVLKLGKREHCPVGR